MNANSRFPTVSVIIPAYGHAEYILQTLDSVFKQSFKDFEIIVINDGSPDRTAEVLRSLIDAGKIRYIYQPNSGVAIARNVGIANSRGKYIAFLDDDDLWPPDKLEWQVGEMQKKNAVAVGGSVGFVASCGGLLPSTEVAGEVRLLEFEEFFDGNPFFSPGQVLIDSDAVKRIGGFDSEIWGADDYDLFIRLCKEGPFLRFSTLSLHYRVHQSNASHNHIKMITNANKVLVKQLCVLRGFKKWQCRKRGHRWMFGYLGSSLIMDVLNSLKERPPRLNQAISVAWLFVKIFGIQMIIDLGLCRQVFRFMLNLFPGFSIARHNLTHQV